MAVCGESAVSEALVLLLQGSGYDTKFMPASSIGQPGSMEGIRLLLLTPTPGLNTERRDALQRSLRHKVREVGATMLELVTSSRPSGGEVWPEHERAVPWPCGTEELKRRIEAALCAAPVTDPVPDYDPRDGVGRNKDSA